MRNLSRRVVPALCALLLVAAASVEPASAGPVPVGVTSGGPLAGTAGAARPPGRSATASRPAAGRDGASPPLVGSTTAPPAGADGSSVGRSTPAGAAIVGGPAARFDWPLAGTPRPVRRFDPPPQPWLPGHRGVDLAATPGVAVRAAGPGVVLFAGPVAGRPVVTVGHADGLRTTYEPVRPELSVGARVAVGTPIGTLLPDHPGCPAEACLHWGLRRGEEYLDPLALLGLGPVRLLPLDPAGHAESGPSGVGRGAAA